MSENTQSVNIPQVLLSRAGVPIRYRYTSLQGVAELPDDVRVGYVEAQRQLRSAIERPLLLGLIGAPGTGKTQMACALIDECCRDGREARYADAVDFFTETPEDADAYQHPHLLILDDMHVAGPTDWDDRMLKRLIHHRYAAMRSTVLISNEDRDTFVGRIGPAIADRINDGGGSIIVCGWASLRGRVGMKG